MKKIVLILFLTLGKNCFSQNIVNLDALTVTATRTPQKITETGRSIAVIDGKLLQQLPVTSIDDLLKYVPGIEIQQRGPGGAQGDIVMRGGTFQQVLVLLDGVRINDPITGHFSSYIPITPAEIERIEVLRGPAAALYGTSAVGGVINIISKVAGKYTKEKSSQTHAGVTAGEYGYASAVAGYYHTAPKLNFSLGGITNNADGQLLRGNVRGYYHNHTVSGSVGIALKNNWNLLLRSSYDSRDFAAQNFYTTFASDTATETVKTWWNQASLKHSNSHHLDEIDIAYKQASDHYLYNTKSITNDNKSRSIILQYLHAGSISKNLGINYGTQFSNRSIVSNDRGDHSTLNGAVFTSLKFAKNGFIINPSVRIDMDENYGTEVLPQANASYQVKALSLRANIGRAVRSADFTERYNNYGKPLVTGGSIGNPDLTAERSWSYEAGADYILNNTLKISGTFFYRDQNDIIDWVTTPYAEMPRKENLSPAGAFSLSKNIKSVSTNGVELELTYEKIFAKNQSLYINTGATLLHSSSSDSVPSFYIISHAKALWQTNIVYGIRHWTIAINTIYKVRNEQQANAITAAISKNYFLANAKLQYAVTGNWNFFAAVNNIGDISYSDLLGSKMPGRWSSFGIRFTVN